MRVITFNVNGIRAATTKGLLGWLESQGGDVICLQEIRATQDQLPAEWLSLPGYRVTWNCATRKGYSGVGLLSRIPEDSVSCGIGNAEFDSAGRVIRADFGKLSIMSLYVPSGISGDKYQEQKMRFLAQFLEHLVQLKDAGRELIICGDLNIAHRPIDLYNPKRHETTSGFLPQERAWMDELLSRGFEDVFRRLVGPEAVHYTWWSNFSGARSRNLGWRLDYQIATPGTAELASNAQVHRDAVFSDHAAVAIDYALPELDAARLPLTAAVAPARAEKAQLELFPPA